MTVYVDPPKGWAYGFPAPLQEDYEQQLRDAGYPEKDLEMAMRHSRYLFDTQEEFEEFVDKGFPEIEEYENNKEKE